MTPQTSRWLLAAIITWSLVACAWSATSTPSNKRFWDERYGVSNVYNILVAGNLGPQNGWYGSLSYLPQTAVLAGVEVVQEITGSERFAVFRSNGDFSPLAYFIVRWITVLYGIGGLLLTFSIGRRVFSRNVAVLGTALLASTPWALRHFVTFKPDTLVLFLVLVTVTWSLDALETPSRRTFLIAGVGVGLAASAKYTGALSAFPVVVAALQARGGRRSVLERLALAGAASVVVFLVLHPNVGFYIHFLGLQGDIYAAKGHSFGSMLISEARNLLHWSFHGPWLGAIALAALAGLCWQAARRARDVEARLQVGKLAVFLSFPFAFSLIYALVTRWPKGNNYLVVVPFTCLAAAWLLHGLWARVSERLPRSLLRPAFWAAVLAVVLLEAWPAQAYLYAQTVSATTLDRVAEVIRRVSPYLGQRSAVIEAGERRLELRTKRAEREDLLTVREVATLAEVPPAELDLADFEVFGEDRLRGPNAGFYRKRMQLLDADAVVTLRGEWFQVRGPNRVLLIHRWYPYPRDQVVKWRTRRPRKGRYLGSLPKGVRTGQPISLEAHLPRGRSGPASVRVGRLSLPLEWNGWDEIGERFATPRFVLPAASATVRWSWDDRSSHPEPPRLTVVRWSAEPVRHRDRRAGPAADRREP